MTKILVVDNYDSFVFNLVQYLQQLGAEVVVKRNDEVNADSINGFAGVLLSPGPGTPEDAGACIEIVNAAIEKQKPLLGVCLGHQAIGAALGGKVYSPPFRIEAIGDVTKLTKSLRDDPNVAILQDYVDLFGLVYEVQRAALIELPPYEGSLLLDNVQVKRNIS